MAGVLPSNVSFFMQRLQGVSTSQFKVFAQSSDDATSGKIIIGTEVIDYSAISKSCIIDVCM